MEPKITEKSETDILGEMLEIDPDKMYKKNLRNQFIKQLLWVRHSTTC